VCPRCGSLDRARHLWLLLERDHVLASRPAVLDVGPSRSLGSRVEQLTRYVSIDVQAFTSSVVPMNLTRLEFPDDYFQVVLCQDVVEHIKDDAAALRDMYRVIRSGGTLFLGVPHKSDFEAGTDEFEEPDRHGHWRVYGVCELHRRLEGLGFEVSRVNLRDEHPELELDPNQMFICHKPASDGTPGWDYALLDWMAQARAAAVRPWHRLPLRRVPLRQGGVRLRRRGSGPFVHKPIST
jgi:SAM-dependent methyltransferase